MRKFQTKLYRRGKPFCCQQSYRKHEIVKPTLFAFICLFLLSCDTANKQVNKAEIIQDLLDSLYKENIFNGAIVVADGEAVILSKGYGYTNFKDSVPFTVNTPGDGGSLAKTFTTAALWKLQVLGKINLNDSVQKFLPEYPYANTTVLDLLTHGAGGLPGYDFFFSKINDSTILTNEMMASLLGKYKPPLLDSTKTSFNYENTGIDLAALIIEKITGKGYQQVLSELFFQPLNMNATYVRPPNLADINLKRAVGYARRNDSLVLHDIADREGFYGSCNLHFTTADLCKWGQSFYEKDLNKDIPKEAAEPAKISGKSSGLNRLNWYYANNKKAFYYWGNVFGFYSHLYHDDEKKFTIAFITNTTLPYSLRQPFASALAEIMETGKYEKQQFILPDLIPIKDPGSFCGTYRSGAGNDIVISGNKDLLHIQRNDELRYNLYIVDSVTAYAPGIDAWINFTKQQNRTLLLWNTIFFREKAFKNS